MTQKHPPHKVIADRDLYPPNEPPTLTLTRAIDAIERAQRPRSPHAERAQALDEARSHLATFAAYIQRLHAGVISIGAEHEQEAAAEHRPRSKTVK
jgi:hypothetical protein